MNTRHSKTQRRVGLSTNTAVPLGGCCSAGARLSLWPLLWSTSQTAIQRESPASWPSPVLGSGASRPMGELLALAVLDAFVGSLLGCRGGP